MVEGKEVTVRACKRLGRGWAQPWLPSTSASTGWWGASTLRDVEDGVCGGKAPGCISSSAEQAVEMDGMGLTESERR